MPTRESFDPRVNSAVKLTWNEKLPGQSLLVKAAELPVKTFVVGPHKKPVKGGTNRPASAPHERPSSASSGPNKHPDPMAPRFLDKSGYWVGSELPVQPRPTQAQPLTATATATAEVANSMLRKQRGAVRPVSAIHSYNDISPVITGEFVREAGGTAHMSYSLGGTALHPAPPPVLNSPRSILDSANYLSPHDSPRESPRTPPGAYKAAFADHSQAQNNGPKVHYGTNPYPGGYRVTTAPYKEAQTIKGEVTHENMYYYRQPGARHGGATRPTSAGAQYYTGTQRGSTRPLSAGPIVYGGHTHRGAGSSSWQKTQHGGGDYQANMMRTGPNDVKVGTVHVASRTNRSVPRNTGHYTSLEAQVPTKLRSGQLGTPLEHPFSRGYATNPEPYFGGQYTVRAGEGGGEYYEGAPGGVDGGPSVQQHAYFTNGDGQAGHAGGLTDVNAHGPYAAAAGNPYWKTETNVLGTADLKRVEELGKGVVAGSANARLVGGQWKYVPRPTEGDVVYTDYYGRYGKEQANYYGRSYANKTAEFAQNRLVDDSSYQKVRASMMGISALRDRPGLSMDATLVHGSPEQLDKVQQDKKIDKMLHAIEQYANLRPEQNTWVAAE